MNILWLSHLVPYPPKGGVLQRSYNLIREIARYHNVFLIAFIQKKLLERIFDDTEQGKAEAKRELGKFCREIEFVPIPCEHARFGQHRLAVKSLFTKDTYTVNWLQSSDAHKTITDWVSRVDFDVIHFDTISLVPYLQCATTQRIVLDHHNVESHMMLRRAARERNWLKKIYFFQEGAKLRRYERNVCNRFDVNITCSEVDAKRLKEIDPAVTVEVIPNGVDTEYFMPTGGNEGHARLVFAGGLSWYPNRQAMSFFAKEVWPVLKAEVPDISIDVIGAEPPRELLELASHDSAFNVHGFVSDVRPYIDRATVYVCPITDGGGTKLKVLDAFAMAKATVAHPIACEGIDVEAGRHVLFATTVAEYVDQICSLISNPTKRKEIGMAARHLVLQKYAYSSIGRKLSQLYIQVIDKIEPHTAESRECKGDCRDCPGDTKDEIIKI